MLSLGMKVTKKFFKIIAMFVVVVLIIMAIIFPFLKGVNTKDNFKENNYYYKKIIQKTNVFLLSEVFDFSFDRAYVICEVYGDETYFLQKFQLATSVDIPVLESGAHRRILFVKDNTIIYDFVYCIANINFNQDGVLVYPDTMLMFIEAEIDSCKDFYFVNAEPYTISDKLALNIANNYYMTTDYEFQQEAIVPFSEIITYYTIDICYVFNTQVISPRANKYYDAERGIFSVPSSEVNSYLSKKFNTKPTEEEIECYNQNTRCYELRVTNTKVNHQAQLFQNAEVDNNVFEIVVGFLNRADNDLIKYRYMMKLQENGCRFLSVEKI